MEKVGIVACSDPHRIEWKEQNEKLLQYLNAIGKEPDCSKYIYESDCSYTERGLLCAKELNRLFSDPEIREIYDISGGDMANQILDYLDFEVIRSSSATFWGYSDLTTVINAIYTQTGKSSVLYQVKKTVTGTFQLDQQKRFLNYDPLFNVNWTMIQGTHIEGIVVGGNIRCFLKLAGTKYFPDLNGKILLLESLGGRVPQMITYLSQLQALGAFEQVRGILLGTFTTMEKEACAPDIVTLVKHFAGNDLPIAKTSEIGHGDDSKAIRIGAVVTIHKENEA